MPKVWELPKSGKLTTDPDNHTGEGIFFTSRVFDEFEIDLTVSFAEYPLDEARAIGAVGEFNDKYGDKVKVYRIAADGDEKPFSLEICGGPHINHTGELSEGGKRFKIIKEESSSAE